MNKLRTSIVRTVITLAVAGIGLVLTPVDVRADVITFHVDETVPGGNPSPLLFANGVTGKYREFLTLNPSSPSGGSFSANIVVEWGQYTLNGVTVQDQIGAVNPAGDVPPNEYGLYALATAAGTYSVIPIPPGPGAPTGYSLFLFEPATSNASVFTDPLQNTTKNYQTLAVAGAGDDQAIMTSNTLNTANSFGSVLINNSTGELTGSFALHYVNTSLVPPFGPDYWEGVPVLGLTATVSGDVDPLAEGTVFPTDVRGDISLALQTPEPASLTLLGIGLLATGFVARRRRSE